MPHWALGRLMDLAVDLAGMTALDASAGGAEDDRHHGRRSRRGRRGREQVSAGGHAADGPRFRGRHGRHQRPGAGWPGPGWWSSTWAWPPTSARWRRRARSLDNKVAPGTANIAAGPAMTRAQAVRAVEAGIEVVEALAEQTDVFGTGDMGIANTTPSTAVVAALTGLPVADLTGRGTGIDDGQLARKIAVVEKALAVNRPDPRRRAGRAGQSRRIRDRRHRRRGARRRPPGTSRSSSTASSPRPGP